MSKLEFDGVSHRITLTSSAGREVGVWPAYNNVDSHASIQPHLRNGTYTVLDTHRPHPHAANPNGPYGSYGIIRFNVPGHVGVGVHSGRASALHMPGPQHATMGCIRTSDQAMRQIVETMAHDPLSAVVVVGNTQSAAHAGRHLVGELHASH